MNFEAKVMAIQESKDLNKVSMEELIGNLITYEMELKAREERKDSESKKKTIALNNSVESNDDDPAEELAMVLKKWAKGKYKPRKKNSKTNKSESSDNSDDEVFCYNCKKPGHIKPNCPHLKNEKKKKFRRKKKAFAAT